nr:hypothetical protein GCM10020185_43430 [Pseudomonas brassicacearum subsp. brassicacearum]
MPNYDKTLAQGNVIGSLVMAVMDPEQPDVEAVFRDFRTCLNDYDSWAESFWAGWALDLEQVFKVGNEVSLAAPKKTWINPSAPRWWLVRRRGR